jgi:tetratricopeptide (TPR) repeat protein
MPLPPEDQSRLTAAEGYITLGMFLEANAEIENVSAELRHLHEVLALRVQIYPALKKWALMETVARALATSAPSNPKWVALWAYATRRADSLATAKKILTDACERHPDSALVLYNLACYQAQLGELEDAKMRLTLAVKIDPQFREIALEDDDLKPVWDSLSAL